MVRSNDSYSVGFLSDERRLNVAITRAKKLCIIIGNSEVVKRTTKEDKKRMWKVEKPTFYDNYKNFLNNMYCYFRRFGKWRDAIDYFQDFESESSISYFKGSKKDSNSNENNSCSDNEDSDEESKSLNSQNRRYLDACSIQRYLL